MSAIDLLFPVQGGPVPLDHAYLLFSALSRHYAGLIYPIAVDLTTFVVGSLYLKETKNVRIWDEQEEARKSGEAR